MAARILRNPSMETSIQSGTDAAMPGITSDVGVVIKGILTSFGVLNSYSFCSSNCYIYGVPFSSLKGIDLLTKDNEVGKYEAVFAGMTNDMHKSVMDAIFTEWEMFMADMPNEPSANVNAGTPKLAKPVVILGVSVASKKELIGLVNKIKSGAFDDVIFGLTNDDHQAAHALVLEVVRGFDYVNLDSDTLSEEQIRTTPSMVSHIDEIVQTVSIQDKPSSYVGATGGSTSKPRKTKANFRSLSLENFCEGVNFSVPRKVFSEDSLSIIESQMESLIMGIPLIKVHGLQLKILSMNGSHLDVTYVKYLVMYMTIAQKKFGGHSVKQNLRNEPKATTNVPMKGATNMGNASKPGLSQVSALLKNRPLKAIVPPNKVGNITMSNLYAALDDESEDDVKNVYDESANLLNSTKTGGISSTFTVAAG
nr:hypothetical protein [Tanacetum cinerariifolium]